VRGHRAAMKRSYLVAYDYGMGAVWAFVVASSADEIMEKYPELVVVHARPEWMSDEMLYDIEERETYDLDASPTGLLADLIRRRSRS
jgi:hypothetical protein